MCEVRSSRGRSATGPPVVWPVLGLLLLCSALTLFGTGSAPASTVYAVAAGGLPGATVEVPILFDLLGTETGINKFQVVATVTPDAGATALVSNLAVNGVYTAGCGSLQLQPSPNNTVPALVVSTTSFDWNWASSTSRFVVVSGPQTGYEACRMLVTLPATAVGGTTYTVHLVAYDTVAKTGTTVKAAGTGPIPAAGSSLGADVKVTVVAPHTFSVAALAAPSTVASGAVTTLSAAPSDSQGHGVTTWAWSDGGAGGTFSPSAAVQNPSYTAPANTTDSSATVTLTVTATCDGASPLSDSDSATLTVDPIAHALTVDASATPSTVASGGTTSLGATATDSRTGHSIATWAWSDGGAGGSFSPSAAVQNPSYTAPANTTDSPAAVTLTITATCDGPSPVSNSGTASLTVSAVSHTLTVSALATPSTVASGGTTSLTATATDSHTGHSIATWSWSDGGAGGSFSPSASVQNPSYTGPANDTGSDIVVTLTITATCDGTSPVSGMGATSLTVASSPAAAADFSADPTRGKGSLSVTFSDLSANSPTAWAWSFGDGATSTDENPSHTYVAAGWYTVTLTATNAVGPDTESKSHYVMVSFTDVPITPVDTADFWALNQILTCVGAGVVSGYDNGTYRPADGVTRDQMAVFVSRSLSGGEAYVPTGPATASFTDVPTDYWAFRHVEYAVEQGVVTGYSDDTYRPTDPVDRGQMAVFMARALVTPSGEAGLADYVPADPHGFTDVATDFWAYKHIQYCVEHDVVAGYDDNTYRPAVQVTRDQMAVYVQRAFNLPI